MRRKTSLLAAASLGAVLALGLGAQAQAQDTSITWKGGPQFKSGPLTFKIGGRVYLDYVMQDVDGEYDALANLGGTPDSSSRNSRFRTARLSVEGTWTDRWSYKAEVNVAGGETAWEDVVLEYSPNDSTAIMVGHFKTVSLENLTSSRYTTFMERGPFNDVLDIGRVVNLGASVNGDNWTAAAYVSGDNINDADTAGDERTGVSGRVTFAPVDTDMTKVHLGAWARYRDGGDQSFRYRARNNTNVGERYIDSGSGYGDNDRTFGVEAALVQGPFSVQAEAARVNVERLCDALSPPACDMGADEGEVTAWYAFASFFPTGESRRYEADKGKFNRIKIRNPVDKGGFGAVELAVRYDVADLSDLKTARRFTNGLVTEDLLTPVDRGGEYRAWTVGANWYPFTYVRFMANYTRAENDNPQWADPLTDALGPDRDADVETLQFRAQFDF